MSTTAEAAFAKIEKMLREQFAANEVTMDTELMADLNIWGEDAIDFMNRYAAEFEIDLSRVPFDRYFRPEGMGILSLLGNRTYAPVTVRLLVESAVARRWLDSDPSVAG